MIQWKAWTIQVVAINERLQNGLFVQNSVGYGVDPSHKLVFSKCSTLS